MKKLLSVLLCLVLALGLLPAVSAPARAAGVFYENDWAYELDGGKAVVLGYTSTGYDRDYVIPAKLGGKQVKSVGEEAFIGDEDYGNGNSLNMNTMTLPNGMTEIKTSAFKNCNNLTAIRIPASVTRIEAMAFDGCSALTDVCYDGTQDQWNQVFFGTSNDALINATIHYQSALLYAGYINDDGLDLRWSSVTGATKFRVERRDWDGGWSGWTQVASLGTVTAWRDKDAADGRDYRYRVRAYVDGVWKTSNEILVTALNEWKYIVDTGDAIIQGHRGRDRDLTIPAKVYGMPVRYIDRNAFLQYADLTGVTIPEGVTTICEDAFYQCENLSVVRLPSTVTTVENGAFGDCWDLSDVYFNGCEPVFWNDITIEANNEYLTSATIHYLAPTLEVNPTDGSNSLEWSAVDGAAQYRVYRRDNESGSWNDWKQVARLTSGTEWEDTDLIPNKQYEYRVRAYVDGEWKAYSNTETVTAQSPWYYMPLGSEARLEYYNGPGGNVTIPAELDGFTVTTLCSSLFEGRSDITGITIPVGVEIIEGLVFSGCSALEIVSLPAGLQELGSQAFRNCTGLKRVNIPASLASVGQDAFQNCNALKDVYYGGTSAEWQAISIASGNACLTGAAIHYSGAPTLTVSAKPGEAALSWTEVAGASQYRVYRRVYSDGKWSGWAAAAKSVKTTSWSDTDVVPGGKYKYRVRAYAGGAWLDYSNAETVTIPLVPVLAVTAAAGKNSLSWSAVPGATQYRVYRRDNEKGSWSGWSVVCSKVVGTSWNDTKVTGGKQYKYQVRAYVGGAWTDYSNAVSVKAK